MSRILLFVASISSIIAWHALLAGCAETARQTNGQESKVPADITEIASNYPTTCKPKGLKLVDGGLSRLCRITTNADIEQVKKANGPHAMHWIHVFMNDAAGKAFEDKAAYPVGSVIVKRKLRDDDEKRLDTGVGGMIKRSPGFDPQHGDWEYFYYENPAKIEHGKIASCVQCHRLAAKTDYVFGHWAKK
ncbi:MAG: cytochrome P460 family protein [Phycisphaeraceae bacterium]